MPPSSRRGPAANRTSSKQGSDEATLAEANATDAPGDETRPGVELLLDVLEGVKATGRNNWEARCPLHVDPTPSLTLTVRPVDKQDPRGAWALFGWCRTCRYDASLPDILSYLGLPSGRVMHIGNGALAAPAKPAFVETLPSPERVQEWCDYLRRCPEHLAYVVAQRGVSEHVAEQWQVGYDEGRECFTLPVFDEGGEVVNVRRHRPSTKPKMQNLPGHGEPPRLYPAPPPDDGRTVVVAEGELDALVARSHGLTAVTGTHGAATWRPEWSAALAGRRVTFIYDCDKPGRESAQLHAMAVAPYAEQVRVLDLNPNSTSGFDLSDWFLAGNPAGLLRARMAKAPVVAGAGQGGGRRG